jgi:hypothetical protein
MKLVIANVKYLNDLRVHAGRFGQFFLSEQHCADFQVPCRVGSLLWKMRVKSKSAFFVAVNGDDRSALKLSRIFVEARARMLIPSRHDHYENLGLESGRTRHA